MARFTDAVNQRDIAGFRELWTDDAVWEIGPPFQSRAEGLDERGGQPGYELEDWLQAERELTK